MSVIVQKKLKNVDLFQYIEEKLNGQQHVLKILKIKKMQKQLDFKQNAQHYEGK